MADTDFVGIPETTIRTLDELAEAVRATPGSWWFRGQTDASWPLWPKVWREYDDEGETEKYLTNLFYQKAKLRHAHFPDDDDYAGWLALMQHYGLPTRLLDWSDSALIAAYFATKYDRDLDRWRCPPPERQAAIWMLDPIKLNVAEGYRKVFPSLNAITLMPTVHAAFKEKDKIKLIDKDRYYDVLAAVPVNHDLRMVMQKGTFTIHDTRQALDSRTGAGLWLKKLTIPPEGVISMEASLQTLGLQMDGIFPDLDHLTKHLSNCHPPMSVRRPKC